MNEQFNRGRKITFGNITESWLLVNIFVAHGIGFQIDKHGIHAETVLKEEDARKLIYDVLIKNNARPKLARRAAGLPEPPRKQTGDVCEKKHGGEEMSELAFEQSKAGFVAMRRKIADIIRESGHDWTAYEMEVHFGITRMGNHNISARFRDLKDRNLIFFSGKKRPTSSGRLAKAYRWRIDSDPGPVGEL